jgi:hypothetical protein
VLSKLDAFKGRNRWQNFTLLSASIHLETGNQSLRNSAILKPVMRTMPEVYAKNARRNF